MYSLVAFLITLTQLVLIIGSHLLHSHNIIYNLLVYGSPFYLVINLLNAESIFNDKSWIYVELFAYHVMKYFIIFRAQLLDEVNILRTLAIVFEAAYLAISAYYNYNP